MMHKKKVFELGNVLSKSTSKILVIISTNICFIFLLSNRYSRLGFLGSISLFD